MENFIFSKTDFETLLQWKNNEIVIITKTYSYSNTAQKIKFFVKDFFSTRDQIHSWNQLFL